MKVRLFTCRPYILAITFHDGKFCSKPLYKPTYTETLVCVNPALLQPLYCCQRTETEPPSKYNLGQTSTSSVLTDMLAEKYVNGRVLIMESQRPDKMAEMQRIFLGHLATSP